MSYRNNATATLAAKSIAEDSAFHCRLPNADAPDEYAVRVGHQTDVQITCYIDGTPDQMRAAGQRLIALADEVERGEHDSRDDS